MSYTDETKVTNAARNIEVSSGKAATMHSDQMAIFIAEADQIIDSRLGVLFYTPLRQITRDSVTKYPDPITYIATRLAASLAVTAVYSRVESRVSDNAKAHYEDAMKELDELCAGLAGGRHLDGQTRKARNFFVNPDIAPKEPPKGSNF